MSKLTDDEIRRIELTVHGYTRQPLDVKAFARAIEAVATEPLLQRIAELEQRNSDLHEDVQRFKKHALNEKAARMELERQLHEQAVSLEEAREDAKRYQWLKNGCNDKGTRATHIAKEYFGFEWDAAIDAAMQKGQS